MNKVSIRIRIQFDAAWIFKPSITLINQIISEYIDILNYNIVIAESCLFMNFIELITSTSDKVICAWL